MVAVAEVLKLFRGLVTIVRTANMVFVAVLLLSFIAGVICAGQAKRETVVKGPEPNNTRQAIKRSKKIGTLRAKKPKNLNVKMVIVVRKDLKPTEQHVSTLAATAAMEAVEKAGTAPAPMPLRSGEVVAGPSDWLRWWNEEGVAKITLRAKDAGEMDAIIQLARTSGLPLSTQVIPNGSSEVAVCAVGPAPDTVIDPVTGHLRLF